MRRFGRHICMTAIGLAVWLPGLAQAQTADLSLSAGSIRFSEATLYAGETVRVYATIRNQGELDSIAQVIFYQSNTVIGTTQPVSVLANGGADDVFVDYTLPQGAFNIRAVIQGADPADSNPNNDVAITPLFRTVWDDDRDGRENPDDNCPDDVNADQNDIDGDNKGDVCDTDIDNDGVVNTRDVFPEDPRKSELEVQPPAVVVVAPPAPRPEIVIATSPAPTETSVTTTNSQTENTEDTALALPVEEAGLAPEVNPDSMEVVSTLPEVQFTHHLLNWRTYEFKALPPLGGQDYAFAWSFGDGATSVQPTLTHTFPKSGKYTVTLAMVGPDNTIINDSQVIEVSFFHLHNPIVLLFIISLTAILGGLLVFIVRLRNGEEI
jgi:hypothetical protein